MCRWITTPFVRGKKSSIPHLLFCGSSIDHQQPPSPGGQELSSVMPPVVPCRKMVKRGGRIYIFLSDIRREGGCLLGPSAILQNHNVVSGWRVRCNWCGHGVSLAPDAVADMLKGHEREERSPSACNLHLQIHTFSSLCQQKPKLVHRASEMMMRTWLHTDARMLVNCDQINKQDTNGLQVKQNRLVGHRLLLLFLR